MNHEHAVPRPLGGKIITTRFRLLIVIIVAGALLVLYRLYAGIGAVSNQSDGYPWGIWEPLCVVVFTGIGAGAYAMGLTTYIFNRWHYHHLVRSGIMVGAMAYTLAGTAVVVNLGRLWNLWVVFWPPLYNLNSVLLEVAICVMAYCLVLWIEVVPAVFERFAEPDHPHGVAWLKDLKKMGVPVPLIQKIAVTGLPIIRSLLPFIISLALLLPTMHQASLGGLYMVAVTKLHPLWHTAWISGLFLISCLSMGFGAIVVIENLTNLVYERQMYQELMARIAPVPALLALSYLVIRFIDLAQHGRLELAFKFDFYSWVFLTEVTLFLVPALIMLRRKWAENRGVLFFAAVLMVFGGAMYRMDTFLVAYLPVSGWSYWPSLGELLFSGCLLSIGIAVYATMVKLFPMVSGVLETKKVRL
jgi:Ni/Fe-hydrogenase subunit HybB-like protein